MAYWAVAQLQPQRQALALHLLEQRQFPVYAPRLRERRIIRGRRVECEVPLFPSYAFIEIKLQWHAARWCPGVIRLVMDGLQPAKVLDAVIEEIRGRERNVAVELPKRRLQYGDCVEILAGAFRGYLAIYAGMSAHERVAVLLQILGGAQRVTLAERDIEAVVS